MRVHRFVSISILLASAVVVVAQQPRQGQRPPGGPGRDRPTAVQIQPGEECPPGTTEARVGRCQWPEFPAPSILDYRPRSVLVTEAHPVPKARYPFVDIHSHTTATAENIDQLVKEMDAMNLQVLVNLSGGSDPAAVKQKVDFIRASKYPDRFRVFANVAWDGAGGPGWAEKAAADLEQAVKNGAIGLKIAKNLGIEARKHDGTRLHVDDPALKPVWDLCARLDIPVIIHTGEPQEFFEPLDFKNERWLELALFPSRRNHKPEGPTFNELSGERDRMFKANPKTRYIGAHFNFYGNDLGRASRQLEETPNLVLELAAVLYDFGRQPRAAREFFIRYQDRILFGKDTYAPSEYPYYFRVLETADEYFDYYRNYHAFWKLYGMDVPDGVLAKVYYRNALRVAKGLPQTGWAE